MPAETPFSGPTGTSALDALDAPVLVTGVAGFIGMHCAIRLLRAGVSVVGIDRVEGPGPVALRHARLKHLESTAARISSAQVGDAPTFTFRRVDIADGALVNRLADLPFDRIIHLAAQAGVRHSIENPAAYTHSNLVGTAQMLELARHRRTSHFAFASSSSVYGGRTMTPFREADPINRPVSYYAATKAANEVMAASYSSLYAMPATALRFFTVYGPWGRPDMAPWLFTEAILEDRPIRVFARGRLLRDFTYVDDIVEGIVRIVARPPARHDDADTASARAGERQDDVPFAVYNIGNHHPLTVNEFIATLEGILGKSARREELPMQDGDVPVTCADIEALQRAVGFSPSTALKTGLQHFCEWLKDYREATGMPSRPSS